MKKIKFILVVFLSFLLFSCSGGGAKAVVSAYLNSLKKSDYESAYKLISGSDKDVKTEETFADEKQSEFGLLFTSLVMDSLSFKVGDETTEENSAKVSVELSYKDYSSLGGDILASALGSAFSGKDSDSIKDEITTKIKSSDVPEKNESKEFSLVKENGEWKIFFNWENEQKVSALLEKAKNFENDRNLKSALESYDEILSLDTENEEAKSKSTQIRERLDYIKSVSVYDFSTRWYKDYFGGRNAGVDFKIRNNGNKELSLVALKVYFKDAGGKTIAEEKYVPVSGDSLFNSSTLKPGYIWQQESGYYYKADSVPSEWKEGNASIEVSDVEFSE